MDETQDTADGAIINQPIYDTTNKGIPLQTMLEYRSKGLSYGDIAKLVGCDKSNVHRRLAPYRDELENLPEFKAHRADYFALQQARLLNSITEDDIKSMSAGSRITGAAILYDKERLERGLTSGNNGDGVRVFMDFSGMGLDAAKGVKIGVQGSTKAQDTPVISQADGAAGDE